MASMAQIRGMEMLRSILPEGMAGPDVNIRAHNGATPGIAFSTWPHRHGGNGGEYHETVIVPNAEGPARDFAVDRLEWILERWIEVETVIRDVLAEARACDADEEGNAVDDDMPTPAWRYHCPSPLRVAMDSAGLSDRERVEMVETSGSFALGAYTVRVHERDLRDMPIGYEVRGRGCRTVKRITVEAPGIYFSQGINRCYLKLSRHLPHTVQTALIGRHARDLIDVPGFEGKGLAILKANASIGRQETWFDLSRNFTMMSTPPSFRRPHAPVHHPRA